MCNKPLDTATCVEYLEQMQKEVLAIQDKINQLRSQILTKRESIWHQFEQGAIDPQRLINSLDRLIIEIVGI